MARQQYTQVRSRAITKRRDSETVVKLLQHLKSLIFSSCNKMPETSGFDSFCNSEFFRFCNSQWLYFEFEDLLCLGYEVASRAIRKLQGTKRQRASGPTSNAILGDLNQDQDWLKTFQTMIRDKEIMLAASQLNPRFERLYITLTGRIKLQVKFFSSRLQAEPSSSFSSALQLFV